MSKQPRRLPSRAAKDLLETTELRVQNPVAAQSLWERVLTTAQRKRLGNDLEAAYLRFGGTIGIWKHLRGGHPLRAMVGAALALNLLTPTDSRWLVQELGESHRSVAVTSRVGVAQGSGRTPVEWQDYSPGSDQGREESGDNS